MGRASREKREQRSARQRRQARAAAPTPTDPRAEGEAALERLMRTNSPGKVSLAGAYAFGYGALGMAQLEGDDQPWFHDIDPLDALFLGTAWPQKFRDEFEFANARDGWLRILRGTVHWKGIESFVREVVAASEEYDLPVDEGELMLRLTGRLEALGLDQRKLPANCLPGSALVGTRPIEGPPSDQVLPEPPADANERIARFWEGTQIELAHDGTPVDALRHGVYLLTQMSMRLDDDPMALLPALYLALVAKDGEEISDAVKRAVAWAYALPPGSSLIPVTDVLLLGPAHGLSADEILARLFALPNLGEPVSSADRRWTSSPGCALINLAFERGFSQVVTRNGKVVRIDDTAVASFKAQLRRFEEKFGRPPGPDDPVFFDPDAETPQLPSLSSVETHGVELLETIGLSVAWIFAYRETKGLLPRLDGTFLTERDAAEWDAAVARYVEQAGDEFPDFEDNMEILRTNLLAREVMTAAQDPEHGRELVAILDGRSGGELLGSFLDRMAPSLEELVQEDPSLLDSAAEFARAWGGATLQNRVSVIAGAPSDLDRKDTAAVLAVAAAFFARQTAPESD